MILDRIPIFAVSGIVGVEGNPFEIAGFSQDTRDDEAAFHLFQSFGVDRQERRGADRRQARAAVGGDMSPEPAKRGRNLLGRLPRGEAWPDDGATSAPASEARTRTDNAAARSDTGTAVHRPG